MYRERRADGAKRGGRLNRRHKKNLNLAIQGFRYLVPETESYFCMRGTFHKGFMSNGVEIYSQIYSLFEMLPLFRSC